MIQAILCLKFVLEVGDTGDIEPQFKPIKLLFHNEDFRKENLSELIVSTDIFGIFYQHTTGRLLQENTFESYYMGRLKETPFHVISYFRQEIDRSQFITISVFDLDDDIEIYEEPIKKMSKKLEPLLSDYIKVSASKNVAEAEELDFNIEKELKFGIFQADRLSKLDKVQKVALIFQSQERSKIMEILRDRPISKRELKDILERIKENPNVDLLLNPFLELNLVRRDWISGRRDKKSATTENQGEFLFLTKDVMMTRLPNEELINNLKERDEDLYLKYLEKVKEFFQNYDPNKQSEEETRNLASCFLDPDCFDFYSLMKKNFYPLKKLPKVLSDFVDTEHVIKALEELNIITKVKDKNNQVWVMLLTEIVPLVVFPEYLLFKIAEAFESRSKEKHISYDVARKALDLLETTYSEKIEF